MLSLSTFPGQKVFNIDLEGGELNITVLAVYRAGGLRHYGRWGLVGGREWTGDWRPGTSFYTHLEAMVPRELGQHWGHLRVSYSRLDNS